MLLAIAMVINYNSVTSQIIHDAEQQILHVVTEIEGAVGGSAGSSLRPHQEEGRARKVLPPQYGVGPKLLEVEVRIPERLVISVPIQICLVPSAIQMSGHTGEAVGVVGGDRIGNLLEVPVLSGAHEGLGIELQ